MKIDTTKLVDIRSNVYTENMDIMEFLKLPASPYQRPTEARAKTKKVSDSLSKLVREHLEVAIAELTEDAVTESGGLFLKGTRFINNGNTRAFYWKNCLLDNNGPKSDTVPLSVNATIYPCKDMNEVRANYSTFDSPNSVEREAEKLAGLLMSNYGFVPTFRTFKNGYFMSALGFACHVYDPKTYPSKGSVKIQNAPGMLALFLEEIKVLDSLISNNKNKFWDMASIAGALIGLKKYGLNNQRFLDFIDALDKNKKDTRSQKGYDGATHILEEWVSYDMFSDRLPYWDKISKNTNVGFNGTVSFFLYWTEKWMNDEIGKKVGAGWDKTTQNFFDPYWRKNQLSFNAIDSLLDN